MPRTVGRCESSTTTTSTACRRTWEMALFISGPWPPTQTARDSLNANIAICDEIHAFKQPKQYNLFKEAMKAYTNKLLIGISTAGDNEQAFLGQRLKYCRKVLDGRLRTSSTLFSCAAPRKGVKDGSVDFTDPNIHEMANPAYGVSIRPEEILNDSLQAQNDPPAAQGLFLPRA